MASMDRESGPVSYVPQRSSRDRWIAAAVLGIVAVAGNWLYSFSGNWDFYSFCGGCIAGMAITFFGMAGERYFGED